MARSKLPGQLKDYWLRGPGAARIRWGTPGDFNRCVTAIQAEVTEDGRAPLPDDKIKGLCANLHKAATGATPGNAPGEKRKR
jgi:hypothetical protein